MRFGAVCMPVVIHPGKAYQIDADRRLGPAKYCRCSITHHYPQCSFVLSPFIPAFYRQIPAVSVIQTV